MTENDILDASQRYRAAELGADASALDDLLTDDFRAVGPLGFVVEKPRWLDRFRNAELNYEAIEFDDLEVRRWGDAAVVIGRWDQRATHMGNPASGSFRVTQIFVRGERGWAVCGVHFSPIAAPPQPKDS
jgi:ketosteroid isomerase-like protein